MAFIEVDEPAMLDSTGQEIVDKLDAVKTAVTGLGTTLATDKANRDASNITDASAWRSAIGLNESTTTLTSAVSQVFRQYIKKLYNIVFCYIDINNLNTTTNTTIGFLPEGYRPYHNINHEIILISSQDESFKGYAHVSVKSTGEITYRALGTYTTTFGTINLVFPIN